MWTVTALIFRGPGAAFLSIVNVSGSAVSVPPASIVAMTPSPLNATAVTPKRLSPVKVVDCAVPCTPAAAEIPVTMGVLGATVRPLKGADVLVPVVTVTVRRLTVASGATVIDTGMEVSVAPPRTAPETPVPLNVTPVTPVKFVPTTLIEKLVPCVPDDGLTAVTFADAVGVTSKLLRGKETALCVLSFSVRDPKAA